MRDHEEHPHETKDKVIMLNILAFNIIDRRWGKILCI
jgi:hypothetical protein